MPKLDEGWHESGPGFSIHWLVRMAFGWTLSHAKAMQLATLAARSYGVRHRVYRSRKGDCWMIAPTGEPVPVSRRRAEAGR